MSLPFFIALAFGALAVYWLMPQERPMPGRIVALIGVLSLGGMLTFTLSGDGVRPQVFYYIFSAIAMIAAVRVITHPRPVYSALHFVMVVLSTAGMMVLLQAEFMAFAMIIIYGGAILVTYMFVIMLATMPQTEDRPQTAAIYDRVARQPFGAVLLGVLLVAAMSVVVFDPKLPAANQSLLVQHPDRDMASPHTALAQMPGKLRPQRLTRALRRADLISAQESVFAARDIDLARKQIHVRPHPGAKARVLRFQPYLAEDDQSTEARVGRVVGSFATNVDRVGLGLFQGHALGIELAAVILLLAMVGAIVISKRRLPEEETAA